MVYPEALRCVRYLDVETSIKQHLRIKASYGTSTNAVKTQIWIIWIAVFVCVLVAIVRMRLGLQTSPYQNLQILSVTLFEKTPILQALQPSDSKEISPTSLTGGIHSAYSRTLVECLRLGLLRLLSAGRAGAGLPRHGQGDAHCGRCELAGGAEGRIPGLERIGAGGVVQLLPANRVGRTEYRAKGVWIY
jgi:hypothetical protein